MAQTVTLQRGELTATHNTVNLLFTNAATGIATRMIPGYLSWTSNFATVFGYCTFGVLRSGAASPNYAIFAANYPSDAARTTSFSPHDTTGTFGVALANANNSVLLYNDTAGLLNAKAIQFLTSNVASKAFFNPNVIIGPSDAVYCAWYDNGGGSRAAVIQYSFALITES
ncbi:MAG: hypothetical protein EBU84_17890 [Actinobacteria bacterium]|nr:hypothetical protein [Actinomycetota bacterium]